ncbi:hypothetical protein [Kribbella kalugense]|uniref:Peptidase inhibitor family I36 n=1 Tax=Kribbella kalugense TaxID=2512221 RepID=A0A4R7Z9D9_9ACTN|nr:hypothetical protein [Kribbella kalugense]TDW14019.1 hypothetical protein EV650_7599 [Kribbella kalugense]
MTRKILAAAGAVPALLALCIGVAPAASAGPVPTAQPRAAAAVPTTSPTVEYVYVPGGAATPCPSQYACVSVPYGAGYYVFKFIAYRTYTVSNWVGTGAFLNRQTGGAAARYDNAGGNQLGCVPADGQHHWINLTPVYRVRLTSTPC